MVGFLASFLPFFKKYKAETVLISIAVIVTIISLTVFFINNTRESSGEADEKEVFNDQFTYHLPYKIDVSGAVLKPDMYEVTPGARLKDIILLAGGLTENADKQYFSRNFNLSRLINDQDKIYVPSTLEITNSTFTEKQRSLDYISAGEMPQLLIHINSALVDELDKLPGIGKTTAGNIMRNRPYKSLDELMSKKVVKKNVFERIKNFITL